MFSEHSRQAIALGLKRYFTGEPCKRGHIAERNVRSGLCFKDGILSQRAARRGREQGQPLGITSEANHGQLSKFAGMTGA
jgi:hypothetical protein